VSGLMRIKLLRWMVRSRASRLVLVLAWSAGGEV